MSQCKLCNRKGIFLSLTENGLCKYCDHRVVLEVRQSARIISDSMNLVDESKNMNTRLSRLELLIEHATALYRYEEKDIKTISPTPSDILKKYLPMKDQIIADGISMEIEKFLSKANVSSSITTKISNAEKALLKIQEGKKLLEGANNLDSIDQKVKLFIHQVRLSSYIEEAKKAEFKGNNKKALDQYKEALYFLKNDDIDDDLQKKEIIDIQNKINGLS